MLARIRNRSDLEQGLETLVKTDPSLIAIIGSLPQIPLRLRSPGFEGLAEIVTAQMVSRASATAIFARLKKTIAPFNADTFLTAGEDAWRAAGLSRAKQTTLAGLARAICEGRLELNALCEVSVEQAMDELTALQGIGPWTAEVFLLFCAGHADIFPAGDIALQHAVGSVCNLEGKPDEKTTRRLAEKWRPLRGVASRVLYAHYAHIRGRSAVPV